MARKTFFMRGCAAVDRNKKTYEEKAQETKQHSARLAEMQRYVDMSEEKRNLLLDFSVRIAKDKFAKFKIISNY